MRTDFYVYLHKDKLGHIFYVGKGTGRRAWSAERHIVWQRYVERRLGGSYTVEVLRDGMTEADALVMEEELISKYGERLINWVNPARAFDYDAITEYHKLRDANRQFVLATKELEKDDTELAIGRYMLAMERMKGYEAMTLETGLVAEMGAGPDWGDPAILDRLVMCLIKVGRYTEAILESEQYFREFPSVLTLGIGKKIQKRIEKLREKAPLQ
jgi:hypothetical protein